MLFPLPPEERTASLGLQGTDKGCEIASLLPVLAQLLADEGGTGNSLHLRNVAFCKPHACALGDLVLTNEEGARCSL